MKVASVEWLSGELEGITNCDKLLACIDFRLRKGSELGVRLMVFPAYTGTFYGYLQCGTVQELMHMNYAEDYLAKIIELSNKYRLIICPGSYWQREGNYVFHVSCIIANGEIILEQKQLYLARWEREFGLARGDMVEFTDYEGWRIGIVLGTDVFYPQVSRVLGVRGANLVLSPVGFVGEPNRWVQVTGMWREVQQNQFFVVESGFSGQFAGMHFWGESSVLAPVEMTSGVDGYIVRHSFDNVEAGIRNHSGFVEADLDEDARKKAIKQFNVLKQMNPDFYRKMGMFEVKK